MQNVLGGYGFLADPALRKRHILRSASVEVMRDHEHVERLVQRVHSVRASRTRRRWEDIRFAADLDDVGRVTATGTFAVERVNGSALEGGDGVIDEAAFV